MRLDDVKREFLEKKKEDDKQEALKNIFGDPQDAPALTAGSKDSSSGSNLQPSQTIAEAHSSQLSDKSTSNKTKASKKANQIWDDEVAEDSQSKLGTSSTSYESGKLQMRANDESQSNGKPREPKVVPAVRSTTQADSVKLDFTERIFPALAMRESQLKEAPAPKLRQLAKKADKVAYNDQESR